MTRQDLSGKLYQVAQGFTVGSVKFNELKNQPYKHTHWLNVWIEANQTGFTVLLVTLCQN